MPITPMPPYFLVKLPRKKIDKVGSIIIPDTVKYMAFNLQCGEVVAIGIGASKYFPEVKIGNTLIFHHFVEDQDEREARTDHLIHQTDTHNYYVVTAYEFAGKSCETYGVWDGEKIIPNRDYIFLFPHISADKNINYDDIESAIVNKQVDATESGILVFKKWEEKRESKEARMAMIKKEIEDLSKSGVHKHHIQQGIAEKEKEANKISVEINKKRYVPFKSAFHHKDLMEAFNLNKPLDELNDVYVMNYAAGTEIIFMDKTYIVANAKYIGFITSQ